MPKMKTEKMRAIISPCGDIVAGTIRRWICQSQIAAENSCGEEWESLSKRGYHCISGQFSYVEED